MLPVGYELDAAAVGFYHCFCIRSVVFAIRCNHEVDVLAAQMSIGGGHDGVPS